jgi:hypothetical protein
VSSLTSSGWIERTERLLLGVELVDALSRLRVTERVRVVREVGRRQLPRALRLDARRIVDGTEGHVALLRHESCVYSLFVGELTRERRVAGGGLPAELVLRVSDPQRRYVPRRVRVDLTLPLPIYLMTRALPGQPPTSGVELCPGAAAPLQSRSTIAHGVIRAVGASARWARLEARLRGPGPGRGALVGVAHGDDRGEYSLVVDARAGTVGTLPTTLDLELGVSLHDPSPVSAATRDGDPFWDLPIDDDVRAQTDLGVTRSARHQPFIRRNITLSVGRDTPISVTLP